MNTTLNKTENQFREIRALYDDQTIRVYQAYRPEIAEPALAMQSFVPPFSMNRMTWIKPSFLWMMYRCGWATKEGQEYVLGIDIDRQGFEWGLRNACLSHFNEDAHTSMDQWNEQVKKAPVRVQWDPERGMHLQRLDYRSIQIGLSGPSVELYVRHWVRRIVDLTPMVKEIKNLIDKKQEDAVREQLPEQRVYPGCFEHLGMLPAA